MPCTFVAFRVNVLLLQMLVVADLPSFEIPDALFALQRFGYFRSIDTILLVSQFCLPATLRKKILQGKKSFAKAKQCP